MNRFESEEIVIHWDDSFGPAIAERDTAVVEGMLECKSKGYSLYIIGERIIKKGTLIPPSYEALFDGIMCRFVPYARRFDYD